MIYLLSVVLQLDAKEFDIPEVQLPTLESILDEVETSLQLYIGHMAKLTLGFH